MTEVRAKAALPVAGEPMIRRIVTWLAEGGVSEVTVNLHHLPATVAGALGDGSDLSVHARYSWEQPRVLGTAGGPRQALSIVGADAFLIVNGDTLTDIDIRALWDAHQQGGALVTLALVPNRSPHRYGGVEVGSNGAVTAFRRPGGSSTAYHFVGAQAVQAEAFRSLPEGQPAQSVGGLYDSLIAKKPGSVRSFVSDAAFLDVGTVKDYWATHWILESQGRALHQAAAPSPTHVTRSIVWDGVEVPPDCVVDECILTDGVRLPPAARFSRAILLRTPGDSLHVHPFLP